jgi:N-methylhydantoinase A/oxoprolinase/acetone carboxylase beta subunit
MWCVVDSEGTFTEVGIVDATTGDVRVWKVPSTPDDPSRAIAHGVVIGPAPEHETVSILNASPGAIDLTGS